MVRCLQASFVVLLDLQVAVVACTVDPHGPQATSVHVELIDLNTGLLSEKASQWLFFGSVTSRPTCLSAEFTSGDEASMLIVTVSYTTRTHFAWFCCCKCGSPGQRLLSVHQPRLTRWVRTLRLAVPLHKVLLVA